MGCPVTKQILITGRQIWTVGRPSWSSWILRVAACEKLYYWPKLKVLVPISKWVIITGGQIWTVGWSSWSNRILRVAACEEIYYCHKLKILFCHHCLMVIHLKCIWRSYKYTATNIELVNCADMRTNFVLHLDEYPVL